MMGVTTVAPQYGIVSGVRELPWRLDPNLDFAKPGMARDSSLRAPLGPTSQLEFLIQVVFESPPYFRKGNERWWRPGEKPSLQTAIDTSPWRFSSVSDNVRSAVATIRDDPVRRDEIVPIEQLVLAQRLFRAGLEQRLGKEFPLDKLALLTRASADAVKEQKTPRWRTSPGSLELSFLTRLAQAFVVRKDTVSDSTRRKIEACINFPGTPGNLLRTNSEDALDGKEMLRLAQITTEEWDAHCVFSDQEATEFSNPELSKESILVRNFRALRARVGISAEDGSAQLGPRGEATCAPM
jgi:hypothetical protein